jgi:hypothetical protein
VLLAAAGLAFAAARRRSARAIAGGRGRRSQGPEFDDPDALERDADRLERAGDLEAALRLRFRAGLARLHQAGVVRLPRTITTGAVGRQLRSQRFDGLGRTFDAVVYGRRPASGDDVEAARSEWPRVLAEAGDRR